jgi:ribonuclease HI
MKDIDEFDILKAVKNSEICLEEISRIMNLHVEDLSMFLQEFFIIRTNNNFLTKDDITNDIKIFIDGGSRGNPGESGLGVVIKSDSVKKGYYYYNGFATNNEAEYGALIKALELAKSLKYEKIKVFSDSELICNQINGIYKVKNDKLQKLNSAAKKIICEFVEFSINYVPREHNKDADRMANLAMDNKDNGEVELTVAGSVND